MRYPAFRNRHSSLHAGRLLVHVIACCTRCFDATPLVNFLSLVLSLWCSTVSLYLYFSFDSFVTFRLNLTFFFNFLSLFLLFFVQFIFLFFFLFFQFTSPFLCLLRSYFLFVSFILSSFLRFLLSLYLYKSLD